MKKLQKHIFSPRIKNEGINEDDYLRARQKADEFILLTYSIYNGILDFLFEQGRITSSHKVMKKLEYKNQRDQNLSKAFKDIEGVILFYYECRHNLQEALTYAKLRTDPGTPSTSEEAL